MSLSADEFKRKKMRKQNTDVGPSEVDGLEDQGMYDTHLDWTVSFPGHRAICCLGMSLVLYLLNLPPQQVPTLPLLVLIPKEARGSLCIAGSRAILSAVSTRSGGSESYERREQN